MGSSKLLFVIVLLAPFSAPVISARPLLVSPSSHPSPQQHASLRRNLSATVDCSAAFGGPNDAIEKAAQFGMDALSMVPGVGSIAEAFSLLGAFLQPPSLVDGRTLYDCISGFVEEAIDAKIDAYDNGQIQSHVNYIVKKYSEFSELVEHAPPNMTDVYRGRIQSAFDFANDHIDKLASYFTVSPGPHDPAGSLSVFSMFVTTQLLPFIKIKYDSYIAIYGGTLDDTASLRKRVLDRSVKTLRESMAYYNKTATGMVAARRSKVSEPHYSDNCDLSCEVNCESALGCLCCENSYSFKDETTGQVFKNSVAARSPSNKDGDLLKYAQAMRRLVVNRVESASRIHIYLSTASSPTWPLLVAGGSNLMMQRRVAVEKNMCFSDWTECDGSVPQGHNYEDYSISDIKISSGRFVDYIRVTYAHRTTGATLVQEFGNPNGGDKPGDGDFSNLLTDPIVGAEWWSDSQATRGVGFMRAFRLTQAGGKAIQAGLYDGNSKGYKDDFSSWKGKAWLCGMSIHGEEGVRVGGIGPHLCYHEDYTVSAPAPPPSPSPPSPPPSPVPPDSPPRSCSQHIECGSDCCSGSTSICVEWKIRPQHGGGLNNPGLCSS